MIADNGLSNFRDIFEPLYTLQMIRWFAMMHVMMRTWLANCVFLFYRADSFRPPSL